MKINLLNFTNPIKKVTFNGRREDRNTTQQLKQDNDYSLTENNQTKITAAIENLSKEKGESNVRFLLDVAQNLTYSTSIDTGLKPRHDWKKQLIDAAQKSLSVSDPVTQKKYEPEIKKLLNTKKPLSQDEKDILKSKDYILKNIDKSQLKDNASTNIKNIERNLNYFIVSSEIPIKQKKYILNRFEYLLSPEYKINEQLKDKKTVVLAEMLNDIVVNTDNSEIPNTKAINQKHHGMCAAISIARKLMSYEYKPGYVDTILSELDNTDNIMVYDLEHLGQGKKIPVPKITIDYNAAQNKGYRIVDAATMQWMNIADMSGLDNKPVGIYTAFDQEHFASFEDTHYPLRLEQADLQAKHTYYQALVKAKDNIDRAKLEKLKKQINYSDAQNRLDSDIKTAQDITASLKTKLGQVLSSLSDKELHSTISNLYSLQVKTSAKIPQIKDGLQNYRFIPNEEESIKERKIKAYLTDTFNNKINSKALDSNITDIKDLILMHNSLSMQIRPENTLPDKIRFDRRLFDAAAAYRTSKIFALHDKDTRADYMIHYNIVDTEKFLVDNIEKSIQHIAKTGDKRFINHFAKTYGVAPDKDTIVEVLQDVKQTVEEALTEELDEFYQRLGLDNRIYALAGEIKTIKNAVQEGDKDELKSIALTMGMKPDKNKVIAKLSEYENILENNCNEKQYTEIFNKVGLKNRLEAFADSFNIMADAMDAPQDAFNSAIIKEFNLCNGLDENADIIDSKKALFQLSEDFNKFSFFITMLRNQMEITDDNGNIINSADVGELILKNLENENIIIPAKELTALQKRYDAIDKIRSSDEFSSRSGKISDPSLYKYTPSEKITLQKINKSINEMAASTNKELNFVFSKIKKPMEEQARQIGVNTGRYWVQRGGSSGLHSMQQSRILQQLTDKPYYEENDLEKAVNIIKNTPHSGVSCTSVFHDKPGWHAQYIAEISNKNGKDILFHDNSWGPSEKENIWIDTEGLTRTDYKDLRGGELGYITDSKWRNGNYTNNLFYKTGHNKPERINSRIIKKLSDIDAKEDYKFGLMSDIILNGVSQKAAEIAAGIKDTIFLPDYYYINDMEKAASTLSLSKIKSVKAMQEAYMKKYMAEKDQLDARLEKTPFNKGITSQQEFDALPDNDPVKVTFEKAAIKLSTSYLSYWQQMGKINSFEELQKIRQQQKADARANFNYAFAKDPQILLAYALNRNKNHVIEILNKTLKNNNIKISEDLKVKIIENTAVYTKDRLADFDGSLKNTVNFFVNNIIRQFNANLPKNVNSLKAAMQLKQYLEKDINEALYFNKKDLLKDTPLNNAIRKYIDKKFNPATDEEFVQIYRKLQDMTTAEFNAATADAQNSDMAYKDLNAYDVLKLYTASNQKVTGTVSNIIYQKNFLNLLDMSEYEDAFQYKKLEKKPRGSHYKGTRTFDDLYFSFDSSLDALEAQKLFNKYKDKNYREYGVFPAYPKINSINDKIIDKKIDVLETSINQVSKFVQDLKINLYVYEATHRIEDFLNTLDDNKKLNKKEFAVLNTMLGEFITIMHNDINISQSVEAAESMIELPPSSFAKEYKNLFQQWKKEVDAVENINPKDMLLSNIETNIKGLKEGFKVSINSDIPVRYRNILFTDLNNWLNEKLKSDIPYYDRLLERRELENKLSSYGNDNCDENIKTDFLNNLHIYINAIKRELAGLSKVQNPDKKTLERHQKIKTAFEKQKEQLEQIINDYSQKYIDPLYSQAFETTLKEYISHSFKQSKKAPYNDEKEDMLFERFRSDYLKYHVLNNPKDILDRFVALCAKDGEIACAKDEDQKRRLNFEKQVCKDYLDTALCLASRAEIQDLLMRAAELGNTAMVFSKFKNYDTGLVDTDKGTILTMADDESIDFMVRNLVLSNDYSTAVLFIEKLGLSEKFLNFENKKLSIKDAQKLIDKMADILVTTNLQNKIITEETAKLDESFENSDDYVQRIDNVKKAIIKRAKGLGRRNNLSCVLEKLDGAKDMIALNPDIAKSVFINEMLSDALDNIGRMANEDIAKIQTSLDEYTTLYNLIQKIDTTTNAKSTQLKEELIAKFDEIMKYNNQKLTGAAQGSDDIEISYED